MYFQQLNLHLIYIRAFEILDNGGLRMFSPENFLKRTQDLPNAYHDAAQFYWASPETWNNEKPIFLIVLYQSSSQDGGYKILIPMKTGITLSL